MRAAREMRRGAAALLAAGLTLALFGCSSPAGGLPSEEEPPDSNGVRVHWDALTEYEAPENQYTRRFAQKTEDLIPADDYGNLIPFPGSLVTTEWMGDEWLYGLVTAQGEIVVDPVYSYAYQLSSYDDDNRRTVYEPYLYLCKTGYDDETDTEVRDVTLAALDGSWARSGYADCFFGISDGILIAQTDSGVEALDGATGAVLWSRSAEELAIPEEIMEYGGMDFAYGLLCYASDEGFCLVDGLTGEQTVFQQSEIEHISMVAPDRGEARNSDELYGLIDASGAWVAEPRFCSIEAFHNGRAIAQLQSGAYVLIDLDGTVLHTFSEGEQVLCSCDAEGGACYLSVQQAEDYSVGDYTYRQYTVLAACDGELQPVPELVGKTILWRYDDTYVILADGTLTLGLGTQCAAAITIPEGMRYSYSSREGGTFLSVEFAWEESDPLAGAAEGTTLCGLYDLTGRTVVAPEQYFFLYADYDHWTNEPYFRAWDSSGCNVLEADGSVVWSGLSEEFSPERFGGSILLRSDTTVRLLDENGTTAFCYLYSGGDI